MIMNCKFWCGELYRQITPRRHSSNPFDFILEEPRFESCKGAPRSPNCSFVKSTNFCDIMLCSPIKVNRRFGGTWNQSSACHWLSRWFLARLIFWLWRWGRNVPPKRRFTFIGVYGVISNKIVLFITTAARTSNHMKIQVKTQPRLSSLEPSTPTFGWEESLHWYSV
jgi:hypothetical protein